MNLEELRKELETIENEIHRDEIKVQLLTWIALLLGLISIISALIAHGVFK